MPESNEKFDVVIIGAGPAGLLAAQQLGKQSIDTIVLEEHAEIGIPTSCAGLISVSGLNRLGIRLPDSVILNRVNGAQFYSPSGKMIKIEQSKPQAYVVDRARFDHYLAQHTDLRNIPIRLNTRAIKFNRQKWMKNQGVEIQTTNHESKKHTSIHSKICINAEGCKSKILRQTGLTPPSKSHILPALQYEYQDVPNLNPTSVEIFTGRKIAPGFFGWLIPTGTDTARVGIACKYPYSPRKHLEYLINQHPFLKTRLNGAHKYGTLGGRVSISGPINKTYEDNFMAVGDTAGQIKPTTGGGVVVGGLCAQIAGKLAAKAVQLGKYDSNVLKEYQQQWKLLLGKEFLAMKWFRNFFNILDDSDLEKMFIKFVNHSIISRIEDIGDMDLQRDAIFAGVTQIPFLDFVPFIPKAAISLVKSL